MKMRAALLYGKDDLRLEEIPVPGVGPGEVLLKVKAAAICGTDIRMFRNGARGATPGNPLVLGHEVSGIVESVGPDVTGYRPGMAVAVAPNMGCGVCDQCVSGNTQMCDTYKAFGINIPGGFAPFMKIPREAVSQGNLAPIPDGGDFVSAALVEPLACVYNAFQRTAIVPGDTVLVIGAGPIGLMHAKVALMAGAARVFMNDLSAERLSLCRTAEPAIIALESAGPEGAPLVAHRRKRRERLHHRGPVRGGADPCPRGGRGERPGHVLRRASGGKEQGAAGHEPRALQADHDLRDIATEPHPVPADPRAGGLGTAGGEGPRHHEHAA